MLTPPSPATILMLLLLFECRLQSTQIAEESEAQRKKIDVYEEAFRKIKEATGVSDVNEVIQKIVSQEDQQNNLMELTKENQAKIEAMNEQKTRLKGEVEELKYSGPGGRTGKNHSSQQQEGECLCHLISPPTALPPSPPLHPL